MKTLTYILFLISLTSLTIGQWRGAEVEPGIEWVYLTHSNRVYINGSQFWLSGDTIWVSWSGKASSWHNISYVVYGRDTVKTSLQTNVTNRFQTMGGLWRLRDTTYSAAYGFSTNIGLRFNGHGSSLTTTSEFNNPTFLIRSALYNGDLYSSFTTNLLRKTSWDGSQYTHTDINFESTQEGQWVSVINDTVFVSRNGIFAFASVTSWSTGSIWYYAPSTGEYGVYVSTISSSDNIRWVSEIHEVGGKKYIIAQGAYPVHGLYEISYGSATKITMPNDSLAYPAQLASSNNKLFIATNAASGGDTSLVRIFTYTPSTGEWTVLPRFVPPDQSFNSSIANMVFDNTNGRLWVFPITGSPPLHSITGPTFTYPDRRAAVSTFVMGYIDMEEGMSISLLHPEEGNIFNVGDSIKALYNSSHDFNILSIKGIPIDTVGATLPGEKDTIYVIVTLDFVDTTAFGEYTTEVTMTELKITEIDNVEEAEMPIIIRPPYFLKVTNVEYVDETEININISSFGVSDYQVYAADTLGNWIDSSKRWGGDQSKWTKINSISILNIGTNTDTSFTWNPQIPYEFKTFHGNFSRLAIYAEVPPVDTTASESELPRAYRKSTYENWKFNILGAAPNIFCMNWGWTAGLSTKFWIDRTCGWVASARTFQYGTGTPGNITINDITFDSYQEFIEWRESYMSGTGSVPTGATFTGVYNDWLYILTNNSVYAVEMKGLVSKGKPIKLFDFNSTNIWAKPIISPVGGFFKFPFPPPAPPAPIYDMSVVESAPGLGATIVSFNLLPYIPFSITVAGGIYDMSIVTGANIINTVTRDYFRGIKPRANRHQNYPYNLKGR